MNTENFDDLSVEEVNKKWLKRLYGCKMTATESAESCVRRVKELKQRMEEQFPADLRPEVDWAAFEERVSQRAYTLVRDLSIEEDRIMDAIRRNVKYVHVPKPTPANEEIQRLQAQLSKEFEACGRANAIINGWPKDDQFSDKLNQEIEIYNKTAHAIDSIRKRLITLSMEGAGPLSFNYPWNFYQ